MSTHPEVARLSGSLGAEIRGIPVVITRTGWTSERGYEIYLLDPKRGSELWDAVMEVGKPYNVRPTGPSDIRRIEGGIFNWGADMTYNNNPVELGMERLVAWDLADGASISIAALKRIRDAGVSKRLVGVTFDGDPFPALNFTKWSAFSSAGDKVGKVTSAIYSPRLRQNIGYCWVPLALAAEGTHLRVTTEWGERRATVTPMPFIDPEKRIPVS